MNEEIRNERIYNINAQRIRINRNEINTSQNKRLKYRLVECSIAVTALFSLSYSLIAYKTAPVNGAIIYTVGENTTELKKENNSILNKPLEMTNGRTITTDGMKKVYKTPVKKKDGDTYEIMNIKIPLYSIVDKTKTNNIFNDEKIEVAPDTYIYTKTVPTREETVKDTTIGVTSVLAGMTGIAIFEEIIERHLAYEERLKSESRKRARENKKIRKLRFFVK